MNGNRTSSAAYAPAADGSCQTGTASSTAATAFTAADQPTGAGLAYDAWGRTTSLPAAHTATPAAGPVALAYYASGLLRSATTGTLVSTWTLDGSDRLACRRDRPVATADASGCGATITVGVVDTVNHYAGGGDAPAWTVTRTGGATPVTSTTRYLPGLDGGMLATVTGGTVVIALADLHGDIPLTATTSQAVAPDGATTDTDEYGQVRDAAGAPTTGPRYAWLGTAQRDATAGSGLTLMGVRVYNPATGRFLTTDPIRGGNTTTYAYPNDPVNTSDTSGEGVGWHQAAFCANAWHAQVCGAGIRYRSLAIARSDMMRAYLTKRGFSEKRAERHANALQHALWMALISWSTGSSTRAWALGLAHEQDTSGDEGFGSAESNKDLVNNGIGIRIGLTARRGEWSIAVIVRVLWRMALPWCRRSCLKVNY